MEKWKEFFSGPNSLFCIRKNGPQETENYDVYALSIFELVILFSGAIGVLGLFSFVFYNSFWPVALLAVPGGIFAAVFFKAEKRRRRKQELKRQFLNAIIIWSDYMRSGRSPESGMEASIPDLVQLYGEEADISREWKRMKAGFLYNRTVEDLFSDFGERCRIEEIRDFSEVLKVAKRSGGRLSEVVSEVVVNLSEQFLVNEKIETQVHAKKFEQKIMAAMPIGILLYIRLMSPDLLKVLYTSAFGRIVMTGCLLAYVLAMIWAKKITEIEM